MKAESAKPTPPTGGISQPASKAGGRRKSATHTPTHAPSRTNPDNRRNQPASSQPARADGGISQPCPTPQPSANNRRNQSGSQPASHPPSQPARRPAESASQLQTTAESASQPASQRGGRRNQPVMPQTTCRSRRPAESATSPIRRPAESAKTTGRRTADQPETCPAAGGKQLRPQDAPTSK